MAKKFLSGLKKGALHQDLGIPQGQKIPKAREEAAASSGSPLLAKRARLALAFRKFKH